MKNASLTLLVKIKKKKLTLHKKMQSLIIQTCSIFSAKLTAHSSSSASILKKKKFKMFKAKEKGRFEFFSISSKSRDHETVAVCAQVCVVLLFFLL